MFISESMINVILINNSMYIPKIENQHYNRIRISYNKNRPYDNKSHDETYPHTSYMIFIFHCGMPLVKGLVVINSMLTCSMTTLFSLICSLWLYS